MNRREFLKLSACSGLAYLFPDYRRTLFDNQQFLANRSQQPAPDKPNVLLIVMDTVRASNMSLYGYPRPTTPNLEGIAKQGVVFEYAISNSPWTLPSPHEPLHRLSASPTFRQLLFPPGRYISALAETLRDQGYQTAGFVGNSEFCSREFGLSRGFDIYHDFQFNTWTINPRTFPS